MTRVRAWVALVTVTFLPFVAPVACGDSAEEKLFGSGGGAGVDAAQGGGTTSTGGTPAAGSGGGGTAGASGGASGSSPSGGGAPGGATGGGGSPGGGGTSASGGTGGSPSGGGSPGGGAPGGGGSPGGGGAPGGGGGSSGTGGLCAGHCGEAYSPPGTTCHCNSNCTMTKCCDDYASLCEPKAVSCGFEQLCQLAAGDYCCATKPATGTQWLMGCVTPSDQCYSVKIYCNGPEDCTGGDVCCGTLNSTLTQFTTMKCESAASCQYALGKRVMCYLNPSACPSGYVCKPWNAPQLTAYCGTP